MYRCYIAPTEFHNNEYKFFPPQGFKTGKILNPKKNWENRESIKDILTVGHNRPSI